MTNVRSSSVGSRPARSRVASARTVALVVVIGLPLVVALALAAFAWPSARLAPRHLPVGVLAAMPATVTGALEDGGAFDVRRFPDQAAARTAVEHREVYGAFLLSSDGVTVLIASAAGPSVTQLLTEIGNRTAQAAPGGRPAQVVDVVPGSPRDPRGAVLASAVLPLVICGVLTAATLALVLGFAGAGRQLLALVTATAVAATGAYLVVQGWLGALPGGHVATWASLWLLLVAISATVVGLYELIGTAGLGLGAALMLFVGNPFSGVTSAPELLPEPAGALGQALPPGAGANLVRSTAYFGGHGAGGHLLVLAVWAVVGGGAVVVGHHLRRRREARPVAGPAQLPAAALT